MADEKNVAPVKEREIKIPPPTPYMRKWNALAANRARNYSHVFYRAQSWLGYTSPHYDERVDKWNFISDHFEGRVLDDDRVEHYLIRRAQGESIEAYAERVTLASYQPDFFNGVSTLTGMLFANESCVKRTWERDEVTSLGDPADEDNEFGKMWRDVDGAGENYESFLVRVAMHLIAYGELWVIVEGWKKDGSESITPQLRLIPPQMVLRTMYTDEGKIASIKVRSYIDKAGNDHEAKSEAKEIYTIYMPEGYQLWEHKEGKPSLISDELVPYGQDFVYEDRNSNIVPPIFRIRLPFDNLIGYQLARKANELFNLESGLSFQLFISNFSKFLTDTVDKDGEVNDKLHNEISDMKAAGVNVLPGKDSKYVSPPLTDANIKSLIIEKKRNDFYTSFFQAYNDAAREKTATEVKQDFAFGPQAILSVLATCMEECENEILYRLEQAFLPDKRELWGIANAMWNKDFSQVTDPQKRMDKIADKVFSGGKLPVDDETRFEVLIEWLTTNDFPVDSQERRDALKEAIARAAERQAQADDMMNQFNSA